MKSTSLTQPQGNRLLVPLVEAVRLTARKERVTVQVGQRQVRAPAIWEGKTGHVTLTAPLLHHLRTQAQPLRIVADADHIRLGPVLAVYALPFAGKRPFGPQTALFAELAAICRGYGASFMVLTPGSLFFERQETVGAHLLPNGSWQQTVLPWPDFVWRRSTVRPPKLARQLDTDERILREHVINGALLRTDSEKWQIYRELLDCDDVRPHLPATMLVQQVDDVLRAARQWHDVYIKPARGTQGQQIVRLLARGANYDIRAQKSARKTPRSALLQASEQMTHQFFQSHLHRSETYIVQETVPLLKTAAGHPFDVRYLIQARPDAPPVCTATIIKVGASDAVTTNLHTGGQAYLPEQIEGLLRSADRRRLRAGLQAGEQLAKAAFEHLSASRTGLAEMGIDVAIDVDGEAKLLEVNPCPGRRMLRQVSPSLRRLSLVRVVEYAVFCTGF